MVMEKSWKMKNWPKVMEFCDQSWEFYQFCPQMSMFFCHRLEIEQQSKKSAFSDVFRKMSRMQNREERSSWKMKKWL